MDVLKPNKYKCMKMAAFWDIALSSLAEVDQLPWWWRQYTETSVYFNETTQHYTPEGCYHLHIHPHKKSHKVSVHAWTL
jgi:hypothetical protein